MIALAGCVQPSLTPDINAAAARVLDRARHLAPRGAAAPAAAARSAITSNYQADGLDDMRR